MTSYRQVITEKSNLVQKVSKQDGNNSIVLVQFCFQRKRRLIRKSEQKIGGKGKNKKRRGTNLN